MIIIVIADNIRYNTNVIQKIIVYVSFSALQNIAIIVTINGTMNNPIIHNIEIPTPISNMCSIDIVLFVN